MLTLMHSAPFLKRTRTSIVILELRHLKIPSPALKVLISSEWSQEESWKALDCLPNSSLNSSLWSFWAPKRRSSKANHGKGDKGGCKIGKGGLKHCQGRGDEWTVWIYSARRRNNHHIAYLLALRFGLWFNFLGLLVGVALEHTHIWPTSKSAQDDIHTTSWVLSALFFDIVLCEREVRQTLERPHKQDDEIDQS